MARHIERRTPKQGRAQATVEAIIEGTARILVQDGYASLSTNKIAKKAGVSVGTLYQYFSDKEAIVEALVDRTADEQIEALRRVILAVAEIDPDLEDGVRGLLEGTMAAVRVRPELSRVLILEAPRGGRLDLEKEWRDRCADLLRTVLYEADDKVRIGNRGLMADVLVTGIFAILRDAVAYRPELLLGDALQAELFELCVRYLRA